MHMCIELVELNETYGVSNWMDRATLFGFSEERDKLLIRNIETVGNLFAVGGEKGFYNFSSFHEVTGKFKCYAIIFCDDLTAIKTFYFGDMYADYLDSTKQLCEIYNWNYYGQRLVPSNVLSTVDVENLSFEIVDAMWGKTMPIFPPVFKAI